MTLISKLGYKPKRLQNLISPILKSVKDISVVIPVKNNQKGIDTFLNTFFQIHISENLPREIIIVDNNSHPEIILSNKFPIPVHLVKCINPGPANARNYGAKLAKGEWLHFTDSDCIPTASLLSGYLKAQNGSLGYAGNVKANGVGVISRYYESQEILLPPKVYLPASFPVPDYLITANCLVWKPAFEKINGFNESITIAGGEDIDLGFKLRTIGQLSYAFDSITKHNFEEDIKSFKERFRRYGKGNRIISELYDLDLTPSLFSPNKHTPLNYILALMQYMSLSKGYKMIDNN
jgi:glycosyltransferase involved in cell wall biosynthesis